MEIAADNSVRLQPGVTGGRFWGSSSYPEPSYPMPLTEIAIRNARWAADRARLYDERGLYLQLAESGGKWWRLKYRFGGKEKLLSLGTYPEVPLAGRWIDDAKRKAKDKTGYLKGARELRDEARELIAAGLDPSAERKAAKEAVAAASVSAKTFRVLTSEWMEHRRQAWTQGTFDAIKASLDTHVMPELGDKPAGEISPEDVRRTVKLVEATGAAEATRRVFQRVKSVYRYAIANGIVRTDPTYSLKPAEILKPHVVRHRAALSERELPDFLRAVDAYPNPVTRGALQLLLLTAVRPGELRGARWDEIDEEKAMWLIPKERMKMNTAHLVPLSLQALEVLESMKVINGKADLVFESEYYPAKPISDGTLTSALVRMGFKGQMSAHGARSVFSTIANESGMWQTDAIERALAHEERDQVRGAYNRAKYLQERRAMAQWWADHLDTLRKRSKVTPIRA